MGWRGGGGGERGVGGVLLCEGNVGVGVVREVWGLWSGRLGVSKSNL